LEHLENEDSLFDAIDRERVTKTSHVEESEHASFAQRKASCHP